MKRVSVVVGFPVFLILLVLSCPSVRADLVGYYSFDRDDGNDASENANHGVVGSAVTFSSDTPGVLGGRSAVADGSRDSLITVASSPSMESISDQLTIAMWVKADSGANSNWVRLARKANEANDSNYGWIVNRFNNNSDALIRIDAAGGFNQNRGGGSGGAAGEVFDGDWHHLAYTLDNGNWEEWVDGARTGSGNYTHGSGFSNTEPLHILGRPNGVLNGLMDDVSVWSHRLEQDEIELLAAGASALSLIPNDNPFRILSVGHNPDRTVTLTWVSDSRPGTTYTVRYSPTLTGPVREWADDNDVVFTGGETTTYTTNNAFADPRMFFLVELNPPAGGGG